MTNCLKIAVISARMSRVPLRRIVNSILYKAISGCNWENIRKEGDKNLFIISIGEVKNYWLPLFIHTGILKKLDIIFVDLDLMNKFKNDVKPIDSLKRRSGK